MSRRDEDVATEMFVINSHDYVMFFTNLGRVYRLKCYEVVSYTHLDVYKRQALCQIRPAYARLLSQYQRILSQRNALLKDIPRHSELLDTLDIWDQRIADFAAEVTRMREWYAGLLEQPAKEVYHGISREKELFSLSYASSAKWEEQKTPEAFFQAFQAARSNDLAAGFTTIGPHRDDLELQINGLSARSFGCLLYTSRCV